MPTALQLREPLCSWRLQLLSQDEFDTFLSDFQIFDVDGDGHLERSEVVARTSLLHVFEHAGVEFPP